MTPIQRTSIVLALLLLFSNASVAQSLIGKIYVTFSDQTTVYGLDSTGKMDPAKKYTAKGGTKFSVVGFDSANNVLISFWRYPTRENGTLRYSSSSRMTKQEYLTYQDSLEFIGFWANYKKFAIRPQVLNSSCKEYFGTRRDFTWGVMTLPVKARFGDGDGRMFDFEERLNLGFVFGIRRQLKGYTAHALNYLAGFGITSARTDSSALKNASFYNGQSALALSFNAGILYQYENFQVGIFLGSDFIPSNLGRNWRYQGKPWIGLAVGVSLFSKNATGGENDDNRDMNTPPTANF